MTYLVCGGARASTVFDRSDAVSGRSAADFVRLFGLDRLPVERRLVCRWHRDGAGKLACWWEIDIPATPPTLARRN